ncbi:uncharacterized protein LOC115890059 isoform X2 [Sitophilus oryzae]|uniref:Uncharacterized protein LOC115890059 isoform X2 n=1 Tax=Sitophilus oryzae TaxID=7048 RepID=A0A6J2YRY0_SITOR|nr:uncharacterized protein LOC115890059 isoform X2 [Sitophilus oryzae]
METLSFRCGYRLFQSLSNVLDKVNMNTAKNGKPKNGDNDIRKSPSPEPFQEPDGMTTVDLNKSDDYSSENDIEKEKIKKKAEIKYLTRLMIVLGSLFLVVVTFLIFGFLNKEFDLFTTIPVEISPRLYQTTTTTTEEPKNGLITPELLNAMFQSEKYRDHLSLCRRKPTIENCCVIFQDEDFPEFIEFCNVDDMVKNLVEYEVQNRKKRDADEYQGFHDGLQENLFLQSNMYEATEKSPITELASEKSEISSSTTNKIDQGFFIDDSGSTTEYSLDLQALKNKSGAVFNHNSTSKSKFDEPSSVTDSIPLNKNSNVSNSESPTAENDNSLPEPSQSRANSNQQDFRNKNKFDVFPSTNEDLPTNQQAPFFNPCLYPYMPPYVQAPNPAVTQDPGFLKVVPVSQPRFQNQPMYVLNPQTLYTMPQMHAPPQSMYPMMMQSPFMQGFVPPNYFGGGMSPPVQVASPGGQYYMCNPIPAPTNQVASVSGVEIRRQASDLQTLMENYDSPQKSREATLICPIGEHACLDNSKCLKNRHICDSEVQCDDSSDEIECSCKDRVGKLRVCDGYCDCPNCDDEQGCFGCEENEFSCDDWSRFRKSTCIPISQRCDNIKQCEITGKDEMDCSILADHIGQFPVNKISNSVGFLHRNYKGKWYPTCFGTELWALQVCQVEAGPSNIIPKSHMTLTTNPYQGLFINILPNDEVSLVNTCVQDRAAFVECPPLYCGLRFLVNNPYRSQEIDTSVEDMLSDLERAYKVKFDEGERSKDSSNEEEDISYRSASRISRSKKSTDNDLWQERLEEAIENLERSVRSPDNSTNDNILEESRVVGGRASQPAAWPWLVSIYKNGVFHCGGVLISESWILTASHCVDRYWKYYYEIQAGCLRRFSYSPMDQRRFAKVIIPHEFYSKANLRNDIALIKLSAPVRYNRYVRPICIPSEATAGKSYLKGPSPGTICTTVGWGATVEHGADPDHMREVDVPIIEHCSHKEDSDLDEICAGTNEGGKDACQGDSGGPLMCRNPNNPSQWYLAGIVSHGEGCGRPNEPGVYTKVSRYLGWIAESTRDNRLAYTSPLQKCPGFICNGTRRCIPKKRRCDRIVDCLLGDDEVGCENRFKDVFKHSRKSVLGPVSDPSESIENALIQTLEPLNDLNLLSSSLNQTSENVTLENIKEDNIEDVTEKETDRDEDEDVLLEMRNIFSEEEYFKCTTLLQIIPMDRRCNKIEDCEDGTDETNCTCADYVRNMDASAICDGITDCWDASDEENCIKCNSTQMVCRLSQKCIDLSKRCDGVPDCPQNEDELDCVTLTNGHTLTLDKDERPMFKSRGIVTINHAGQWTPYCFNSSSENSSDEPSVSTVICNMLGFDEYHTYSKYQLENRSLNISYSMKEGRLSERVEEECVNCCEGLFISCSNVSMSSTLNYKSLEQVKELYFSPWTVAIYSNGNFKCMGTLLDHFWIVTSSGCFNTITKLHFTYVTAVFGKGKLSLPIRGPHEQIIRIIESIVVNQTDIILLRLEHDVKFNRYVQSADLDVRRETLQTEKCYAVGRDNDNQALFVPLSPMKNCMVGYRCFEKKIEVCQDIHPWSGTIFCDSRNGWYPAAVYNEKTGHCGFSHEKKYTSLKYYKNVIFSAMEQPAKEITSIICHGFRCDLGNCISKEKLCNGIPDCTRGEDEENTLCYEKEKQCNVNDNCVCPSTDLKCPSSNKCFPKSSFCDRANNCGEFEDEPDICSCKNYLKLTDPGKICDGVVHCMDRSDEDPDICSCKLNDFECGKSNKCVSQEMVCDGFKDCPHGEDETVCLSLQSSNHEVTNAGEVMSRTAGIWHSGCFEPSYSMTSLEKICKKLGFTGGSASQLPSPKNISTQITLRPIMDKFDVVWIRRSPGNKLKIRMRSGNVPYVRLVPDDKCHRLFVACI